MRGIALIDRYFEVSSIINEKTQVARSGVTVAVHLLCNHYILDTQSGQVAGIEIVPLGMQAGTDIAEMIYCQYLP